MPFSNSLASRSLKTVIPPLLPPLLLPLGAAFVIWSAGVPARAQGVSLTHKAAHGEYVIPADGAYGVEECISRSSECGQVVASAWCEAHGHSGVRAFGPASDVTFSTGATAGKAPRNSIIIACQD